MMMADEDNDQVESVTPLSDYQHPRDLAKEALSKWRGAQLLVEKPIKHSRRTADEVLGTSEHSRVIFTKNAVRYYRQHKVRKNWIWLIPLVVFLLCVILVAVKTHG
jgi:hypothetical protein